MKRSNNNVEKLQDFVNQNTNAKSPIQKAIKFLTKETNKNKFNYNQLRYIFRAVRENCNIEVSNNKKSLYELPNKDQLDIFYNNIKNPSHKLIFSFLQGTGLRVSEMTNLQIKNINFDENLILIIEGKGKKDRVIPFGNRLKQNLQFFLEGRNNRYLFESNRNTKYSTRRIEQLCKQYSKNIEIKITPHTFRHLYFSFLASNSISKEHRMIIAGHSKPETQDIYTHLTLEGIKDDIIKILDY